MIYITGDTHGDIARFSGAGTRCLKKGDTVIVCGDFGFLWDGSPEEEKVLDKLAKKKYQILFVDGTHENFDLLRKLPQEEWCGGQVHKVRENVLHLMRGQVFEIEGKRIFTFGGGENPDKEIRLEAKRWWECEMPTVQEMRVGVQNLDRYDRKVDYIVTHEPPLRVRGMLLGDPNYINALEAFLDELSKAAAYEKWFFGSLHIDRKLSGKNYAVFRQFIPVEEPAGRKGRR